MKTNPITTEGRVLAIAAGLVFILGTLGILFEDILTKGAPLALKHGLTLVILAGTIMTGHLANAARHHRQFLSAAGFSLVFLAGTALVVYSSVGRQVDASVQTASQIDANNERRSVIKRTRTEAQGRLDTAMKNFAKECGTGKGKKCDGIKATIDVYTFAVKGHDADLDKLGPTKAVAPEAEQLAEVASVVFGADKARVKAGAILAAPFLITLFLEFGSIVSLGYGFSPRRQAVAHLQVPTQLVVTNTIEPMESLPAPVTASVPSLPKATLSPKRLPRGGIKRRCTYTQSMALADLLTQTAIGKKIESQDQLAERWNRPKGTCSKWLAKWESQGLIARTRVGHFKATEAA